MNTAKPINTPLAGILYTQPDQKERVEQLADSLGLPVITNSTGYDFVLSYINGRLYLSTPNDSSNPGKVYVEFIRALLVSEGNKAKKKCCLRQLAFGKINHCPFSTQQEEWVQTVS